MFTMSFWLLVGLSHQFDKFSDLLVPNLLAICVSKLCRVAVAQTTYPFSNGGAQSARNKGSKDRWLTSQVAFLSGRNRLVRLLGLTVAAVGERITLLTSRAIPFYVAEIHVCRCPRRRRRTFCGTLQHTITEVAWRVMHLDGFAFSDPSFFPYSHVSLILYAGQHSGVNSWDLRCR